jgi:hypothetical protein
MRAAVRMFVIVICLSPVALLGACGSKQPGAALPTPSPSETLTIQLRAGAYFETLLPILEADRTLLARLANMPARMSTTNAFSVAATIDGQYLPAVKQIEAQLAAIKPPPGFAVAHARLEKVCALEGDFLSFLRDAVLQALNTHTLDPGYVTEGNHYIARLKQAVNSYDHAVRAAAKRAGVALPRLITGALT